MAKFSTAYEKYVKPSEGGYANIAADKGGETYAGIARNYHPTWQGWIIIDMKKSRYANGVIPRNEVFEDMDFLVTRFYQDMWDRNYFSQVQSQEVANLLFDYYVNSGASAIKAIQRLVNVTADGAMGTKTIAAINAANANQLHDALKKQRGEFYESLIQKNPSQEIFRTGWFARLAQFPDLTSPGGIGIVVGILAVVGLVFFLTRDSKKMKAA